MLGQPCLRAQCSTAARSCAPAPRLRWTSATMSPFNSARVPISTRCVTLTCAQPITPASGDSATNRALGGAVLSLRRRCAMSAAVAGYPSCPVSSARSGVSLVRALRITTADFARPPDLERFVGVEEDRDWTFIYQLHGHSGLKNTSGHTDTETCQRCTKLIVERFR